MASVTYKYRSTGYKYHQCTEEIMLPTNQYGNILFDTLTKQIENIIAEKDSCGILIWHRINQVKGGGY